MRKKSDGKNVIADHRLGYLVPYLLAFLSAARIACEPYWIFVKRSATVITRCVQEDIARDAEMKMFSRVAWLQKLSKQWPRKAHWSLRGISGSLTLILKAK